MLTTERSAAVMAASLSRAWFREDDSRNEMTGREHE